jgi:hypothetical protein
METVRLNLTYDLLQKTKLSSNTANSERQYLADYRSDKILHRSNQNYFVICNSCYWCASYFGIDDLESFSHVLDCHACNSHNTNLIPISIDESFKMN